MFELIASENWQGHKNIQVDPPKHKLFPPQKSASAPSVNQETIASVWFIVFGIRWPRLN